MKPVPAGIYLTMLQLSELVTPAFALGHAHKFPTTQGRLTESPLPLWAGQSHMTSVLQHGSFLHAEARSRGADRCRAAPPIACTTVCVLRQAQDEGKP